jgi:hypothetical protein
MNSGVNFWDESRAEEVRDGPMVSLAKMKEMEERWSFRSTSTSTQKMLFSKNDTHDQYFHYAQHEVQVFWVSDN